MNKLKFALLLPIIFLSISSCSLFKEPEEKDIDKTKLNYTYQDYAKNSYYELSVCPSKGNVEILVIPVWFTDSSNYIVDSESKQNVWEDIYDSFNAKDTSLGWYSVSSYYNEESKDKLGLSATLSEWYECEKATSVFARSNSATANLTLEVVEWYFSTHNDSRKKYDSDGDGYLDAVALIYGAPDYVSLGEANQTNLWAYTSWLTDTSLKDEEKPGVNVFLWSSYDFMYSAKTAFGRAGSYYGKGETIHTRIDSHTFIHEMGHVFGLEDYYDYSDNGYTPAGCFSMQDYNIGGHDPFSTIALGWANPYVPTESMTLTIKDFQSSHDVILLASHNVTSPFDEYMLIELYTPNGLNDFDSRYQYGHYPKGPVYPGIRLWHVDARLLYVNNPSRVSDKNLTDNPLTNMGSVLNAFSNSYSRTNGSVLGQINPRYYDYNTLQLIRGRSKQTYRPNDNLTNGNMLQKGDSYDQKSFKDQFVNQEYLNDETELGWTFKIKDIKSNSATITLYKTK